MKPSNALSAQEVRNRLRCRGQTVSGWARDNGFTPRLVFDVLDGRLKGNYGKAHRAAVMLGVKAGELLNE